MSLLHINSGLVALPAAQAGVSVTPSATAFTESAKVPVVASTAQQLALAGVVVKRGIQGIYIVSVWVGPEGSEERIAEIPAVAGHMSFAEMDHVLAVPIPIDRIPAGSRVSVSLRKEGTDTTAWEISISAIALPVDGHVVLTQQPLKVTGLVSVAGSGSAWTSGAYQTAIASTAAPTTMAGYAIWRATNAVGVEFDLAAGEIGSEAVAWTTRYDPSQEFFHKGPTWTRLWPLRTGFSAGTRLALRARVSSANTGNWTLVAAYYEDLEAECLAAYCTEQTNQTIPAAADAFLVPQGNPGAWVELIASTASELTLVARLIKITVVGALELSVGAEGSEADGIVETWLVDNAILRLNDRRTYATVVPAGVRLSARIRQTSGSGNAALAFEAIPNATIVSRAATSHGVIPDPIGVFNHVRVTSSSTAWEPSSIVEVVDATFSASPWALTGFSMRPAQAAWWELDVLFGAASSETVAATSKGYAAAAVGSGGHLHQQMVVPIRVPAATRVSLRLRTSLSSAANFDVFFERYGGDPFEPTPAPPSPVVFDPVEAVAGKDLIIPRARIVYQDDEGDPHTFLWSPVSFSERVGLDIGRHTEARLIGVGEIVAALSDLRGVLQRTGISIEASDLPDAISKDTLFRAWLERSGRTLRNVETSVELNSLRGIIAGDLWLTIFRGSIERYGGPSEWRAQIEAQAWPASRYDDPVLQVTVGELFPAAPPAARSRRVPLLVGSLSDEGSATAAPVLVADESGRGGQGEPNPISSYGDIATAPTGLTASEASGQGTLMLGDVHANTYYVMVTRVVSGVESDPLPFLPNGEPITITGDDSAIDCACDDDSADAYRFYLGQQAAGGGEVTFAQFIETADPVTGVRFTDHPPTGTVATPDTITSGASLAVNLQLHARVIAQMPDGRTEPSVVAFVRTAGYLRPVRLAWTPIGSAVSYELYLSDFGPDGPYGRRLGVPTSQTNSNDDAYAEFAWTASGVTFVDDIPTPQGMIPPIHVGKFTLAGYADWDGFLVSGRPDTPIAARIGGVRITDDQYGNDILAPGPGATALSSWATHVGADLYYEVNGYQLAMVFLRGPLRDAALGTPTGGYEGEFRVNSLGALGLTHLVDLFALIADNGLLHQGANHNLVSDEPLVTAPPSFADGTPMRDAAVFSAVKAKLDAIFASNVGGRWIADDITWLDLVAEWCVSTGARAGFELAGPLVIAVTDPDEQPTRHLIAGRERIRGSFSFADRPDGYGNVLPVQHEVHYDAGGGYALTREVVLEHAQSQTDNAETRRHEPLPIVWRHSQAAATAVGQRYLDATAYLLRSAGLDGGIHWVHLRLGQLVAVTDPEGTGARGWDERVVRIDGMRVSPGELKAGLTVSDQRRSVEAES